MYCPDSFAGSGGDDTAGKDFLAGRSQPAVPNPGKGENQAAGNGDTHRLFPATVILPLVKSISGNKAAPLVEGFPKGRFSVNGLSPGIKHFVTGICLPGPAGY
jgi:hypothetical protein